MSLDRVFSSLNEQKKLIINNTDGIKAVCNSLLEIDKHLIEQKNLVINNTKGIKAVSIYLLKDNNDKLEYIKQKINIIENAILLIIFCLTIIIAILLKILFKI